SFDSIQAAFKTKKAPVKKTDKNSDTEDQQNDAEPKVSVPNSLSPIELSHIKKAQMLLAPFVLRRRKADVMKELPKKIESVLKLPLTDTQSKKYNQLLEAHKKILEKSHQKDLSTTNLQLLAYPNEAISQNKESIKSWIGRMMELRKVANHPVLVRSFYTEEKLKKMASLILLIALFIF
ncbi:hypothetical protein BB560_006058, partial [Smittium megazygosporum]